MTGKLGEADHLLDLALIKLNKGDIAAAIRLIMEARTKLIAHELVPPK